MLAVLLIGAVSTVASNTAKEKQAAAAKTPAVKMHVATGQVVSISDTTLVLSHKVKGKMEQTSYTLTSETKREGTVESGAKATVHYKMESGQELATLVKVKPAKAAKAATHKP
jgi:RNA-splicing ligase RtcB